jgi:uncharacterized Fe-S cluster-containing MiaB family protein
VIPPYPNYGRERDAWVVARRPIATRGNPWKPNAAFHEIEPDGAGGAATVSTVLLRNRACPWKCLMCDLWRHATDETVPLGALAAQIDAALRQLASDPAVRTALAPARWLKLYNGGSFFDPFAVPETDYTALAAVAREFDRVIVECHPALVGPRVDRFLSMLRREPGRLSTIQSLPAARSDRPERSGRPGPPVSPQLEVAMGLECIHPEVLPKLNKGMTLDSFRRAADRLRRHGVGLRAFVLVQPPFLTGPEAAVDWAVRSAAFAFEAGARVVSLIPTRTGNGALDALAVQGHFSPPTLRTFEQAMEEALALGRGIVLADLWDLERFSACPRCFPARLERLRRANLEQRWLSKAGCPACGTEA